MQLTTNIKKFRFFWIWLVFCFVATISYASEESILPTKNPIQVLKSATDDILEELRDKKDEIRGDRDKLYSVVYDAVVPHVDFEEISKWVAGKKAWRSSTEAEQQQFLSQFKLIIIRTYATALNKYSDQKVEFKDISQNKKLRKRMQIPSEVWDSKNNKTIKVDFRIIASGNTWKVYDLVIEGVSLLKGFQVQFSNLIRTKGLGAAIAKMREHNSATFGEALVKRLTKLT